MADGSKPCAASLTALSMHEALVGHLDEGNASPATQRLAIDGQPIGFVGDVVDRLRDVQLGESTARPQIQNGP